MHYNKVVAFLFFLVLCCELDKAASLQIDNGEETQKNEDNSALKMSSNNFIRRLTRNTVHSIKKRNICLNTLIPHTKYNCKDIISGDAENLAIMHWPQAQTRHDISCVGRNGYNRSTNIPRAATTVVKVWNEEIKTWQKIKVTVGYFCARRHVQ